MNTLRAGAVVTYHNPKVFDRIGITGKNLTTQIYVNGRYIETQWENQIVRAVEYVGHLLVKEELHCLTAEDTLCVDSNPYKCGCSNCKKYLKMEKREKELTL